MSTAESEVDLQRADFEAVTRHAFEGTPLDPEVERRIEERANRVTEEIRRIHGVIDEETLNQLIRDVREES